MEQTIITWNMTNWITILMMVVLGFVILATIPQVWMKIKGAPA